MPSKQPDLPPEVRRRAAARQAAIRRAAQAKRRAAYRPTPRRPRQRKPLPAMNSMFGYGVVGALGLIMLVAILMVATGHLPSQKGSEPDAKSGVCAGAPDGPTLTRILQALAAQESGGNIKSVSGTGAKGKYQYIDSTWKSHASKYYPPASKYSNALSAPEEYQDALAYIEYAAKYKAFGGNLFKLAVSHFYPAANSNPALLDVVPGGNVVTPRQYANQFTQKVKNGTGSNIPIKAEQAPKFKEYLNKVGGNC